MARIKINLSEAEQSIVAAERYSHPDLHVRRKMLVLGSVQAGLTRSKAGEVAAGPPCNATLPPTAMAVLTVCGIGASSAPSAR
jgi:hypothetical protein